MAPSPQRNACLPCRQRKLKCDRQQPCANCNSRSLECKDQSIPLPSRGVKRPLDDTPDLSDVTNVLSRLDRIEFYLKSAHKDKDVVVPTPIGDELNGIGNNNVELTSHEPEPCPDTNLDATLAEDQMQASRYSANDSFLHNTLMHDLSISISADYKMQRNSEQRQIHLPPKWETLRFFQVYFKYLGQFQHILYEPHTRSLIEEVYHQVANFSTTIAPRGLALILTVIAIALLLEPIEETLDAALPILKDRLTVSAIYIRYAMDCLEQHRRRMDHTLENVQALIILGFTIHHIETFSSRYRLFLAEAVAVSHSLGFHAIDLPSTKRGSRQVEVDPVTQEIKRRIWWYLTATDWVSSKSEGTSGVVYLVQPNLINTDLPKHINDDDIGNLKIVERPLSEPTTMSYNMQRLKVAEIARCISDLMPNDPSKATCELILTLDAKLESLLNDLPDFFKIEFADSEKTQRVDETHPFIPTQRLLINLLINIFRCGLHYPFISGRANKSLHTFSREASLKAARVVLSSHRGMNAANMSHSADFMKIQGTIFHMFVGALVLTTDLCCNQPRGQEREIQSAELVEIFKRLDGIKNHSQMAARLLEVLNKLLVDYGVWLSSTTASTYVEGVEPLIVDLPAYDQLDTHHLDIDFPLGELWETYIEQSSVFNLTEYLNI